MKTPTDCQNPVSQRGSGDGWRPVSCLFQVFCSLDQALPFLPLPQKHNMYKHSFQLKVYLPLSGHAEKEATLGFSSQPIEGPEEEALLPGSWCSRAWAQP